MNRPRFKIMQPIGIDYMIQKRFYEKEHAQVYIDMLINKMIKYISLKKKGERVAPLMTIKSMEDQLLIMKKFKIVPDVILDGT